MKRLLVLAATVAFLALFSVKEAQASEGQVELRSTRGENARCYAASILMRDLKYRILVSCRDITYAADANLFIYLVWATPIDGSAPVKLGELGVGKIEYITVKPFSAIFVTEENNVNAAKPSNNVAMSGNIRPISFLENPPVPTPTPQPGQEVAPTPTPIPQAAESVFVALKKAGLLFGAVVVVIVLLVIVTRR